MQCKQYCPDVENEKMYGDIGVTLKSVERTVDFVVPTYDLRRTDAVPSSSTTRRGPTMACRSAPVPSSHSDASVPTTTHTLASSSFTAGRDLYDHMSYYFCFLTFM